MILKRSRIAPWFKASAATVAVLLAAIGCSTASTQQSANEGRAGTGSSGVPLNKVARLPDDSDLPARPLTNDEEYVIAHAVAILTSRCMEKNGFSFSTATPRSQDQNGIVRPYPSLSELRRGTGYRADFQAMLDNNAGIDANEENSPAKHYSPDKLAAYHKALNGTHKINVNVGGQVMPLPTDGCAATAYEQIFGSYANAVWLGSIGSRDTPDKIALDLGEFKAYAKARDLWKSCMRQHGVTWMDDPNQGKEWDNGYEILRNKALIDNAAPSESLQSKIAKDDAACQVKTGLDKVRAKYLPIVKKNAWKHSSYSKSDMWHMQQFALKNAKAIQ